MLLIVGVFFCISSTISAPINDTNTWYVLAKVLFYKNAKGQIVVANGPVPSIANLAIRDDIISRIKDTSVNSVKVVSFYNESKWMPKSVNIYQLIKNEQKPVFVTEVKTRLTRTIKDWWNKMWGHNKKPIARIKKKMTVNYVVTPSPDLNFTSTEKELQLNQQIDNANSVSNADESTAANNTTQDITHDDATASTTESDFIKGKQTETTESDCITSNEDDKSQELNEEDICQNCATELPEKSNEIVNVTDNPQTELLNSLEAYDDFIPNDIYYSVEKRCVNWSDICDVQTGGLLNMSTANFNYFKPPIFTQNGPLME